MVKSESEPSFIKHNCIFPKVCHFFLYASDTQPWLHIRIMWRSFKTYQCLGLIIDQLNQNVYEYRTGISMLNNLPGWVQCAVTMENRSSLSSCRIQAPFILVFLPTSSNLVYVWMSLYTGHWRQKLYLIVSNPCVFYL